MTILPVREVMERIASYDGVKLPPLTDEQLFEVAERCLYAYGTITPLGGALLRIVGEVVGEAGGHTVDPSTRERAAPASPAPHRPLGWRSEPVGRLPSIDPTELLDFERDHPHDTTAKWRRVREVFGRSRSTYVLQVIWIVETPEAQASHPDVCNRVLQRREELRAARNHPAGYGR